MLFSISLFKNVFFTQRYQISSANAERARWNREARNLISQISKNCPGCKSPTEKSGKVQGYSYPKCQVVSPEIMTLFLINDAK